MTSSPAGPTPSKLYVSNLSRAATLSSVRELFRTCGEVLEVEFAAERGPRGPSAAYVTMATSSDAERALKALHGRLHGDRTLMISRLSGEGASASPSAQATRGAATKERASVVVTQQYRDRLALTYELSCSGKLLTLRFVLPPDDAHDWRIEARVMPGSSAPMTAEAMTREQAFRALIAARDGHEHAEDWQLDWGGVAAALRAVRGL
jgi:hypothetical protein